MEKIVKDVYTDVGSPYAFGGINRLYNGLKELGYNISKSKIKNILKSIPSYTLHKQPRKKFKRRPIMTSRPGLYMNCDLLEYSELSKTNKNYRYLLVCQDMFSRYVYTELLKNKKADSVVTAFKFFFKKSHHKYKYLQSDEGKEFFNSKLKKLLNKHGIHHYHTYNRETKASLVERFLRTYQSVLYRMMTEKNTNKFLSHHKKIISSYNMRPHIGLNDRTPHDVHFLKDIRKINVIAKEILDVKLKKNSNKSTPRQRNKKTINRTVKLKVGSYVRLVLASATQAKFTKGYKQQNTQEVFKIQAIKKNTHPITYKLKDLSNELVKGSFYIEELVETVKPDFFLINEIIRSKTINNKKIYFVSWKGYDDSFNSWIESEAIYNLKKNK